MRARRAPRARSRDDDRRPTAAAGGAARRGAQRPRARGRAAAQRPPCPRPPRRAAPPAAFADKSFYELVVDPRTGQLVSPMGWRPRAGAPPKLPAGGSDDAGPPVRVARRRRPAPEEEEARILREFDAVVRRIDVADLIPRDLEPEDKKAIHAEILSTLRCAALALPQPYTPTLHPNPTPLPLCPFALGAPPAVAAAT